MYVHFSCLMTKIPKKYRFITEKVRIAFRQEKKCPIFQNFDIKDGSERRIEDTK